MSDEEAPATPPHDRPSSGLDSLQSDLERIFLEILDIRRAHPVSSSGSAAQAPPSAQKGARTPAGMRSRARTPAKRKKIASASLVDLDIETELSSAEGYALLVRGRRELRQARVHISELESRCAELESLAGSHAIKADSAEKSLCAAVLRAEDAERSRDESESAREILTAELRALRAEMDTIRHSASGSSGGTRPFDVLASVENLAKSKDRETAALRQDCKALRSQLRAKDKAIADINSQLRKARGEGPGQEVVVRLKSEVKLLETKLDDMRAESRTMERHFRLRSKAMERESERLSAKTRGDDDTLVQDLRNQIRLRDRTIRDLEDEKRAVQRIADRQTRALAKTSTDVETGAFGGAAWQDERKVLLAEISSEKEKRVTLEREVKANNHRIATMHARMDHMAEVVKKCTAAAARAGVRSSLLTAGPMHRGTEDDLASEYGVTPEDDTVPADLYDALMREIKSIRAKLAQKDTVLSERDTIIEALERKSGILDKARNVESRKGKQEAAQMATAIAELKMRIVERTEEFKERELQLRMLNLRLKNQLKAANEYIQEYVGADSIRFDPNSGDIDGEEMMLAGQ